MVQPYLSRRIVNVFLFDLVDQVQEINAAWLLKDNEERPHEDLGSRLEVWRITQAVKDSKSCVRPLGQNQLFLVSRHNTNFTISAGDESPCRTPNACASA
jgi:hypothetical protein